MGDLTETEDEIFGIKPLTVRPYEYFDNVHIAITFEFELNYYRIDREAYNMLDWLGDLGGLKEALMIILGFIFGLFNYNSFENFLVSQLYRAETEKDKFSRKDDNSMDLFYQKNEGKIMKHDKLNCIR